MPANQMQIPTLLYLSIFYYTSGKMSDDNLFTSGVQLLDSYPSTGSNLVVAPHIVLTKYNITPMPFQIGGTSEIYQAYVADIYAKGEQQRDDLAWIVLQYFWEQQCSLNDYNEGFPPSVTPTSLQTIYFENARILPPVYIVEGEAPEALRWNAQVLFDATILN